MSDSAIEDLTQTSSVEDHAVAEATAAPEKRKRASRAGRLAQAQADRQQRVIAAALELAAERGTPDAIQMSDITDRSNVSRGTVYKYYSSKEQVLAAALVAWAGGLDLEISPSSDEASVVDQAVAVVRKATDIVAREPNLVRTLLLSAVSTSGHSYDVDRDLSQILARMLEGALICLDDANRQSVQRILEHVWYATLMRWLNGWRDLTEVGDELEFACRCLLTKLPLV